MGGGEEGNEREGWGVWALGEREAFMWEALDVGVNWWAESSNSNFKRYISPACA